MISSSQFFKKVIFSMEEDANDSAELELGPWETEKPIKKYSTIETHKKKSQAKSLTIKRIKQREKSVQIAKNKKNLVPLMDIYFQQNKKKKKERLNNNNFVLPPINREIDSLSNFQLTHRNKNYSPLSKELKKILERKNEENGYNHINQRKLFINSERQHGFSIDRFLKNERKGYNIYDKCIVERKNIKSVNFSN